MKKWIFKIVLFFVFFTIVSIVVFEVSLRFATADFFINLMDGLGFLGVKSSFDSLFILLLLLLFSFFIGSFIFTILMKKKGGKK